MKNVTILIDQITRRITYHTLKNFLQYRKTIVQGKHLYQFGVFLLLFSCNQDDPGGPTCVDLSPATIADCSTETFIDADVCILQEVIAETNGDKWVYEHDGTNYTKVEFIQNFDTDPMLAWEVSFEYDAENRISRTLKTTTGNTFTHETTFNYDDQPNLVMTFSVLSEEGEVDYTEIIPVPYYPVQDSTYLFESETERPDFPYFLEFENGNLTRFYARNEAGTCERDGYPFKIYRYYYDNRPNAFSDFAVLLSSPFPEQYWFWLNANNLIGNAEGSDTSSSCPSFLTNSSGNYWIKTSINRTYYYDCEE